MPIADGDSTRRRDVSRRTVLIGCGAAAAAAAAGVVFATRRGGLRADVESLTIAGGEESGIYIEFAQLLAAQLVGEGVAAEAAGIITSGSTDNIGRLGDGQVDLALAQADAAPLDPDSVVALGRVYLEYVQCVVRADGEIPTVADVAGRTVSVGARGSGTALVARRALAALDIDEDDVSMVELRTVDAADRLSDGRLDAFFFSSGLPARVVADLASTLPIRLLELHEALTPLHDAYPGIYETAIIDGDVYGLESAVRTIGVPSLLLCRPELDAAVAADIIDVLLDRASYLVPAPSLGIQYLTLPSLVDTSPFTLHPGAADRYRQRYG